MGKILALSNDDECLLPHGCRPRGSPTPWTSWLKGKFRKAPASAPPSASTSSAAQKYTPTSPNAPSSGPGLGRSSGPSSNAASQAQAQTQTGHQVSTATRQGQAATLGSPPEKKQWILFGVRKAQRVMKPAEIPVTDRDTNYTVFQGLKNCYKTHRGRLRLWFSIWRLEYCEVSKVRLHIASF